ncbi:c-type cytochrome [Mucilaginibacter psychrotolerans]|uniref:Cytochrome c domain-containing protein n=1 Tax=Mucilaginibacter psychrotolerans TaxID=1524096 RepID=A0A4Y8SF38_9SPHI|nr:c-type cytochrome [Mucilaginibacter psychrotolerans]TFF37250.1 hypothetical protein E2R66_12495 [Mucilaginibacter psychrotolerans]
MKRLLIILGVLSSLTIACTHDGVAPQGITGDTTTGGGTITGGGTTTTPSDVVCFQTDVLPLFQTYCASAGCHNATTKAEGLVLISYANIMRGISANNTSGSKYYKVIQNGSMPPRNKPQLSSIQVTTIAKWINQGALNNTCAVTVCDTTKTTYNNGISQLFATYCNGCHGVSPGSGNVILSNYASAKSAGTSMKTAFLNGINFTSANAAMNMPQSGKLSSCQITQITKWINGGCPQ